MPPPQRFDWGATQRPNLPLEALRVLEVDIAAYTSTPDVPEGHRGTYLGLIDRLPSIKAS
jgi:pullulanase/glycogen debranching enzyme